MTDKYKGMDESCPRNRFMILVDKDQKRCAHEWDKWDGTEEDGIRINDIQCARLDEFAIRANAPKRLMIPCDRNDCLCIRLGGIDKGDIINS